MSEAHAKKEPSLEEQLAELDVEEERERVDAERKAGEVRLAHAKMRKDLEKKYSGPEGRAFVIIEDPDGWLFHIKKPEPLAWQEYERGQKGDVEFERLVRRLLEEDKVWERVSKLIEDYPFGVRSAIIVGLARMLAGRAEVRAKK